MRHTHDPSTHPDRGPGAGRGAASEEGWALIEALMAAVVLVIAVLGVMSALDASSHTAGFNRQRSVASALAEQALEEMRGRDAVSLANFRQTITQNIRTSDGKGLNTYTVVSGAEWVRDSTGAIESCSDTTQGSYLKISSTATAARGPAAGIAARPVAMSSLMAPTVDMTTDLGTLAVKVQNAAGNPVVNTPVALSGTGTLTGTTNSLGCVVFGYITPGSYTVQATAAGLVDKGGVDFAGVPASVTGGTVKTVTVQADQAASLTAKVQTKLLDGTIVDDPSEGVVAANTGVPLGSRNFAAAPYSSSIPLTKLYPFTNGYTVFSGSCLSADPSQYVPDYFSNYPGAVTLAPGAVGGSVTLREPALNLKVTKGGSPLSTAKVFVYALSGDCTDNPIYTYAGTTGTNALTSQGTLAFPGLPFGHYKVCAYDQGSSGTRRRFLVPDVANVDPNGTALQSLPIPTSGTGATCPTS